MTGAPIIKKLPGNVMKFNHEKDGYVSLEKLNKTELLDLVQREEKLLNNKRLLSKLQDKGQKIKCFAEKARLELKKRNEHEDLLVSLANLNVNESKEALEKLEWTGKYETRKEPSETEVQEEINPFKILVTHSSSRLSKDKQIKIENAINFIKLSDLNEKSNSDLMDVDVYAKILCNRFDCTKPDIKRKPFYAHKSLNVASVHDIIKDKEPNVAVPSSPTTVLNKVKMLSLQESITIQQQQIKNLKEIELHHAMEKLRTKTNIKIGHPEANFNHYRNPNNFDSDDENSSVVTNEDFEGDEGDTAVFYNLVD